MAANDLQARGDGWRAADEERDGEIPEMSRQPVTRKACNECRQQKVILPIYAQVKYERECEIRVQYRSS